MRPPEQPDKTQREQPFDEELRRIFAPEPDAGRRVIARAKRASVQDEPLTGRWPLPTAAALLLLVAALGLVLLLRPRTDFQGPAPSPIRISNHGGIAVAALPERGSIILTAPPSLSGGSSQILIAKGEMK
jgi:hypothetical protein